LRAGVLGSAGLSLADLLRAETSAPAAGRRREKSVIILWMRGGPSHIDTWDPKPDAPVEYRGEFGTAQTKVPGIQLIDLLPRSAEMMNKWSILRSLCHTDMGHSSADQLCFTGYPSGTSPEVNAMPSCGSIVARQLSHKNTTLPAYVMIPKMVPGTGSAHLGVGCRPFETQVDPGAPGAFRVPNFVLAEGLSLERLTDRQALMKKFDRLKHDADTSGQMDAMDRFQRQAWDILTSPAAEEAFDIEKEPRPLRERYGFQPAFDPMDSRRCSAVPFSQRVLLARRLVEAGVRLVTVDMRWWDTHVKGFESLKLGFLERFDIAYSALIHDLDSRGLLESTLVVAWGEFGRTPLVNRDAGRDHYPNVFSAALAGGPIQGGRVLGASDAHGAFPAASPKTPQDVLATLYHHLDINTESTYLDNTGRPVAVLPSGQPLRELM
jgi:hypothetical protein